MASSGNHVPAGGKPKHLRLLLPFTTDSLRITDELAKEIDDEVRVVVLFGGKVKVWPVEVGRDRDGAFLGRGWKDFTAACGVGLGWSLILRHQGGGVLSLKAFDGDNCVIMDLGAPPAATTSRKGGDTHKAQFLRVRPKDFMEKMLVPAKFVQHHIHEEHKDKSFAVVLCPLVQKVYRIGLEMDQSGLFLRRDWPQFLASHGITRADFLLLKYEGNMAFRVKVFDSNGFLKELKHKDITIQQVPALPDIGKQPEAQFDSIQKRKSEKDCPSQEGQKKPKGPTVYMNNESKMHAVYEIGPPSWIEKDINTSTLTKKLSLSKSFCAEIGLREPCTITLKTSNSTKSWKVRGVPCSSNNSFVIVWGWKMFCQDNSLKEGDICTFNIDEATLWHVAITRYNKEKQESPSASSRKLCGSEGQKRPEGSVTPTPKKRSVFEIGPPAWMKKEINNSTMEKYLSLPTAFCDAIGLREPCTITLKTPKSSTKSWQVRAVLCKNGINYVRGLDWKRFCKENEIKVGDVCTFNIVETTLWHVEVTRQ